MSVFNYPEIHGAYTGPVDVRFLTDESFGLRVYIDTERLHLASCGLDDVSRYARLFGDREVASRYGGAPKTLPEIRCLIEGVWERLWRCCIPYSAFPIFDDLTDEFIGHIAVDPLANPGEAELSVCLHKKFWGKRVGTEAISAVVLRYLPLTISRGYLIHGKPLSLLTAVVRADNVAIGKILNTLGFEKFVECERKDGPAIIYQKSFSEAP